jgi:hypothetical protein
VGLVLSSQVGRAQEGWQVRVECPELSAEDRAELEVRHLVELKTLHVAPQVLVLRCEERSVLGGWEEAGKLGSQKLVTREPGDNLLELLHAPVVPPSLAPPWRVGAAAQFGYWGTQVPGSLGVALDASLVFAAPFAVHVVTAL